MTMETPVACEAVRVTAHWTMLPSFLPVPGMGVLPVNSFLLKGPEPMLVDTGLGMLAEDYEAGLASAVDPGDLRWIWISHLDADHVGNLRRVLQLAPNARVLTGYLGKGKMGLAGFDVDRVDLVEPGRRIEVAGRSLVPLRPPYFDAPETLGFFDVGERVLFAADSFGAILPEVETNLHAIDQAALRSGMASWSAIDSPWLHSVDRKRFATTLASFRDIAPEATLSGHLPVITSQLGAVLEAVADAWCSGAADGHDPFAIEAWKAVRGSLGDLGIEQAA